jgi:hypothetical protein
MFADDGRRTRHRRVPRRLAAGGARAVELGRERSIVNEHDESDLDTDQRRRYRNFP